MAGYDDFSGMIDMLSSDREKASAGLKTGGPSADLQLKMLKQVVGDSLNKTHVKMITVYTESNSENIPDLEAILNDPSCTITKQEYHWGSASTTTEEGTTTTPCLSILVTYNRNDYSGMLSRIEDYAENRLPEGQASISMLDVLAGAVASLKLYFSDTATLLKADALYEKLSERIQRLKKENTAKTEAVPFDNTPEQDQEQGSGKKGKSGKSKSGASKTVKSMPKVFQDLSGEKVNPDQTDIFEIVQAAEQENTEGSPAPEKVAKEDKV